MRDIDVGVRLRATAPRPLRRVLAAVSLDEDSAPVLAAAAAAARAAGSRLLAIHAEEPAVSLDELAGTLLGDRPQELRWQLERLVEEHAGAIGVPWEVELSSGAMPAHRAILDLAERSSADLLVLGATRRGGKLLGSTAERVLREAWCPVLVVRGALPVPPRRVVAPVDLSLLSGDGFRCGLEVVAALAGGREVEATALFAVGYLDPLAAEMRREGRSAEEMRELGLERLKEFVAEHQPQGALAVAPRLVQGPARDEIVRVAREGHADLVVMATRGFGGYRRLMLGSVAAAVARQAPCSVLLVPPRAALDEAIEEAVLTQTAPGPLAGA